MEGQSVTGSPSGPLAVWRGILQTLKSAPEWARSKSRPQMVESLPIYRCDKMQKDLPHLSSLIRHKPGVSKAEGGAYSLAIWLMLYVTLKSYLENKYPHLKCSLIFSRTEQGEFFIHSYPSVLNINQVYTHGQAIKCKVYAFVRKWEPLDESDTVTIQQYYLFDWWAADLPTSSWKCPRTLYATNSLCLTCYKSWCTVAK